MEFDDKPVADEEGSAEPVRPMDYGGSVRPGGEIDTLEQILDELRSMRREQQHREFSFWGTSRSPRTNPSSLWIEIQD